MRRRWRWGRASFFSAPLLVSLLWSQPPFNVGLQEKSLGSPRKACRGVCLLKETWMIYGFLAGIVAEALFSPAALSSIAACRVESHRPPEAGSVINRFGLCIPTCLTLGTANCSWDVVSFPETWWWGWEDKRGKDVLLRADGGREEDHEEQCHSRWGKPRRGPESNDYFSWLYQPVRLWRTTVYNSNLVALKPCSILPERVAFFLCCQQFFGGFFSVFLPSGIFYFCVMVRMLYLSLKFFYFWLKICLNWSGVFCWGMIYVLPEGNTAQGIPLGTAEINVFLLLPF